MGNKNLNLKWKAIYPKEVPLLTSKFKSKRAPSVVQETTLWLDSKVKSPTNHAVTFVRLSISTSTTCSTGATSAATISVKLVLLPKFPVMMRSQTCSETSRLAKPPKTKLQL